MQNYKEKQRENKLKIQERFYDSVNMKSNVLCLAGPKLDIYLKSALKIASLPKYKIISYELDSDTLNCQRYLLGEFDKKIRNRVQLLQGCISEAQAEQFIDADLMRTIRTEKPIIEKLLRKQIALSCKGEKVFIGTVSVRGITVKETKKEIEGLVLQLFDTLPKIDYDTYRDEGCPMFTFKFIYE